MHTLLTERLTLVRVTIRCKVCVKERILNIFLERTILFRLLTGPTSLQVGYLTISPQNLVVEKIKGNLKMIIHKIMIIGILMIIYWFEMS